MNPKKLSAVLIALILAFSLSTVAFAAPVAIDESTTGTIDITAQNEGDTFAAYRIVDVTYTAASNSLSYVFDPAVKDFFDSEGLTVAQYSALVEPTATRTPENVQGELAAWIMKPANSVTTTYTGTANSGKTCSISGLPLGQYLVLGTGNATSGAYVYQIMTANVVPTIETIGGVETYVLDNVALESKVSQPTISKTAADDDNAIVSAYDNINYTITVSVPAYPSYATSRTFTVADSLPDGISYVTGSLVIKNAADTQILSGTDFTSGKYAFNYADIAAYAGDTLTLTYQGILNSTSLDSAVTNLTNTATLTYSSSPYGSSTSTVTATAAVQTNKFTITKVDSANTETVLPNAQFDVYAAFTQAQYDNLKTDSGVTAAAGSALTALGTAPADTAFYKIGSLTTDANGQATMHQVEDGTYYLVETKAPSGYSLPSAAFTVTVGTNGAGSADISNTSNIILPGTGGAGTVLFTVGGIAILVSAGAFLFLNRKRVFGK